MSGKSVRYHDIKGKGTNVSLSCKEQSEGKVALFDGRMFIWKGKPMTTGWKTAFKSACRKAGLVDLRFHDLHHTFVTRKVREG